MKKYDCVQDASTAARSRSIGSLGERLAEDVLSLNGFTNIKNLNMTRFNYQYADVYAEKDGERFVISVKTRNKFTAGGALNPSCNLIEGGDLEYAKSAEETEDAKAAWVAIALEDATFDAYFGLLSSLSNPNTIPMRSAAIEHYLCLARGKPHGENPLDFRNIYKRNSDTKDVFFISEVVVDGAVPITRSEDILGGIPVFAGTRVPVKTLFDYLKASHALDDFLDDFPTVTRGQAQKVLEAAQRRLLEVSDEPQI